MEEVNQASYMNKELLDKEKLYASWKKEEEIAHIS